LTLKTWLVVVASTSDGASHRAENGEDHSDHEHDDADAPEDGELGNDGGDDGQADAENDSWGLLTSRGTLTWGFLCLRAATAAAAEAERVTPAVAVAPSG
jgi:hypothetical protein